MKSERVVGWALVVAFGVAPGIAWLANVPLGDAARTVLSLLCISGLLLLYAGDGLGFPRRDPIGFTSIAFPALAVPIIGLATGFPFVGSTLGIAFSLAFLIWGNRTWPLWERWTLRRPAVRSRPARDIRRR
jgi:hypothetical protein